MPKVEGKDETFTMKDLGGNKFSSSVVQSNQYKLSSKSLASPRMVTLSTTKDVSAHQDKTSPLKNEFGKYASHASC